MNKRIKKIFILAGVALFCFQVASFSQIILPRPHPVVVKGNWHVFYTGSRVEANDFHLCGIIESVNNVQPKLKKHWSFGGNGGWYLDEFTIEKVANHRTNWYFTAHFQTDKPIPPGTLMHFGLVFVTNYCNTAVVNCAYWTNYKEAVGRVPLIGFKIYGNRLRLINTAAIPVELNTIELAVVREEVPLEEMFTEGLGDPGTRTQFDKYANIKWIPVQRSNADRLMVVEPNGELEFDLEEILGRRLSDNEFLLIRGNSMFEGKKMPFWLQHEDTGVEVKF